MSVALLDRQRQPLADGALRRKSAPRAYMDPHRSVDFECQQLFETSGPDASTLDDLITEAWRGVEARQAVRCPACWGKMALHPAAPEEAPVGACLDCGAWLS